MPHLRRAVLGVAVAFAIGALSPSAAFGQSVTQPRALEGTVRVIWGDPQSGSPVHLVALDTDAGTYELRLDAAMLYDAGGLMAIQGARVAVAGNLTASGTGRAGIPLEVRSIRVVQESPDAILPLSGGISGPTSMKNVVIRPNPRSIPYVTILCFFPDSSRVVTAAQVKRPSFDAAAPSADHYWREVSEGLVNFAGSVTVGPYTLPNPWAFYVGSSANLDLLMQDCTGLADADVNFSQVAGIALQFNTTLDCCAWGGTGRLARDGPQRYLPTVWMPTWTLTTGGTWAHEVGHALGLPHSSGPYGQVYDSRWDVMSTSTWKTDPASALGFGNQTNGYHKLRIGLAPGWRRANAGGAPERIHIVRSANTPNGSATQVVVIPLVGRIRQFYTVEVRRPHVGSFYDDSTSLGLDGVLIHRVNERLSEPSRVVDADGNGNPNDAGAIWTVGEAFRDVAEGIRVTVDSASTTGFWVTVENGRLAAVNARDPRYGGDSLAFGAASVRVDSSLITTTGASGALTGWQAWSPASWVVMQSASATGTGYATWTYRSDGLGSGQFRDSIVIRSTSDPNARTSIPVVLKIGPAGGPSLGLSQAAVNDTVALGQWGAYRTVTVTVPTGVTWTATRAAGATRVAFCVGSCSTGNSSATGTGPGTMSWYNNGFSGTVGSIFTDTITVTAAGLIGSPALVVQRVTVANATTLAATARTRRESMPMGAATVADSAYLTFSGAAATTQEWTSSSRIYLTGRTLDAIDARGAGNGWVRWTRGPRANAVGRYIDTLWVQGARVASLAIVDTVDVIAPATQQITIAPTGRTTTVVLGSSFPLDSTIVAVLGFTSASWTATASSTRIFIVGAPLPNGVALTKTGASALSYVRRTAGLTAGTYVDTITITSGALAAKRFVDTLVVTTSVPAGPIVLGVGMTATTSLASTDSLMLPVRLELAASGGTRVGSVQGRVAWDTARFTFRRAVAGSLGTGALAVDSSAAGNVRFSYADAVGTTSDLTLLTLTLLPHAGVSGFGSVAPTVQSLGTQTGTTLMPQAVTRVHTACVGSAGGKWGDANGDAVVNIIDAQQIARYSVSLVVANAAAVVANGDVTSDNAVNIIDAQQIARFTVGLSAAARVNSARLGGGCP